MFNGKIRESDLSIIDVNDDSNLNSNLTSWYVRSSDLVTIEAIKVPTNQAANTYTLTLLEPISGIGTWELIKTNPDATCFIIFADPLITEPAPQTVLNFIAWVGEDEAKKLSSLGGDSISYNLIENAIEQASTELNFMMANVSEFQKLIYEPQREHLIRIIARFRLDRICPREFVKADYEALVSNLALVSNTTTSGMSIFSPSFAGQGCCDRRKICGVDNLTNRL
jgi:hypothetical protein